MLRIFFIFSICLISGLFAEPEWNPDWEKAYKEQVEHSRHPLDCEVIKESEPEIPSRHYLQQLDNYPNMLIAKHKDTEFVLNQRYRGKKFWSLVLSGDIDEVHKRLNPPLDLNDAVINKLIEALTYYCQRDENSYQDSFFSFEEAKDIIEYMGKN